MIIGGNMNGNKSVGEYVKEAIRKEEGKQIGYTSNYREKQIGYRSNYREKYQWKEISG